MIPRAAILLKAAILITPLVPLKAVHASCASLPSEGSGQAVEHTGQPSIGGMISENRMLIVRDGDVVLYDTRACKSLVSLPNHYNNLGRSTVQLIRDSRTGFLSSIVVADQFSFSIDLPPAHWRNEAQAPDPGDLKKSRRFWGVLPTIADDDRRTQVVATPDLRSLAVLTQKGNLSFVRAEGPQGIEELSLGWWRTQEISRLVASGNSRFIIAFAPGTTVPGFLVYDFQERRLIDLTQAIAKQPWEPVALTALPNSSLVLFIGRDRFLYSMNLADPSPTPTPYSLFDTNGLEIASPFKNTIQGDILMAPGASLLIVPTGTGARFLDTRTRRELPLPNSVDWGATTGSFVISPDEKGLIFTGQRASPRTGQRTEAVSRLDLKTGQLSYVISDFNGIFGPDAGATNSSGTRAFIRTRTSQGFVEVQF